ncbi:MAG: DUF3089 domain-containing protein [Bacteroidales bacterium]|nr:DUF3089 domain-containing protein [Bacteroidales bacterium]
MKRLLLLFSLATLLLPACADDNASTSSTFIPQAPDYTDATMWYTQENDLDGTGGDVFYIVSTWETDWTSDDGQLCHYADPWNPSHREHMTREISKVADYMGSGNNFYSPFYRHMTIEIWATQDEDQVYKWTRLSMKDVCDAFDHFNSHRHKGRPFVLAGFSQGGLAVVELLKHLDDATYQDLAAAYVLGYKVTPDDVASCSHIKAAQGETDTGVTICYNTVKDVKYIVPIISAPCAMCINPVNWVTDATPATFNDTITVTVSPEHHVLVVTGYDGAEYPPIYGFLNVGDIHSCEPWLYQSTLGPNISARIAAHRKK